MTGALRALLDGDDADPLVVRGERTPNAFAKVSDVVAQRFGVRRGYKYIVSVGSVGRQGLEQS